MVKKYLEIDYTKKYKDDKQQIETINEEGLEKLRALKIKLLK